MKRYIRTKDGKIVETGCYKDGWYVGKDLKQSDNIFDLIKVGDLINYRYKNKRHLLYEIRNQAAIKVINSDENYKITKIYTKQGNNYFLAWDKWKGII